MFGKEDESLTAGVVKQFLSQIKSKRDQREETNMKHLPYDDEYESDNVDQNDVVWMTTCCSEKESQTIPYQRFSPEG